ncbi:MAG: branched-chain amino acid aminotransferase [Azospirillaceae bacterium]
MSGRTLTYVDGGWQEGSPALIGPDTHAMWMASVVFDGARAMEGRTPDLDRHCARLIESARVMGLEPVADAETVEGLSREGVAKFPAGSPLYIRPMMWAERGFVAAEPDSTRMAIFIKEAPLPEPSGVKTMVSAYRRASPESMPTLAKASCLYPQAGLALQDARRKGFDNAIMLDMLGNVAELATANVWIARDGIVHTPVPNGTFLNGITRQRIIALMRAEGIEVVERTIRPDELDTADEAFTTGNYGKVMPITRIGERNFQPGPFYKRARELYWDYVVSG